MIEPELDRQSTSSGEGRQCVWGRKKYKNEKFSVSQVTAVQRRGGRLFAWVGSRHCGGDTNDHQIFPLPPPTPHVRTLDVNLTFVKICWSPSPSYIWQSTRINLSQEERQNGQIFLDQATKKDFNVRDLFECIAHIAPDVWKQKCWKVPTPCFLFFTKYAWSSCALSCLKC